MESKYLSLKDKRKIHIECDCANKCAILKLDFLKEFEEVYMSLYPKWGHKKHGVLFKRPIALDIIRFLINNFNINVESIYQERGIKEDLRIKDDNIEKYFKFCPKLENICKESLAPECECIDECEIKDLNGVKNILFKDTNQGKVYKEEMDKKYPRTEVDKDKLRKLLENQTFTNLIDLCLDSKKELIDHFLAKSNEEIDDTLFTYLHSYHKFAYKLKKDD